MQDLFSKWLEQFSGMIPGETLEVSPDRAFYKLVYGSIPWDATDSDFMIMWHGLMEDERQMKEWALFSRAWNDRFGIQLGLDQIKKSGWYLIHSNALHTAQLLGWMSNHAIKRWATLDEYWDKVRAKLQTVAVRIEVQSKELILHEITEIGALKPLVLEFSWHGFSGRELFWAMKEHGFKNTSSPFFVELPGPGTIPFQRATILLQHQMSEDFGLDESRTIIFLNWLHAAGDDNALRLASDLIHKRGGTKISRVKRALDACFARFLC